jgi:hypothetical protein
MDDKIEPPTGENATDSAQKPQQEATEKSEQDIFDELFHALMDNFGEDCEKNSVELAIAIAQHPDHQRPMVFYRGHLIEAASLAADVLRQVKHELFQRLDTDVR